MRKVWLIALVALGVASCSSREPTPGTLTIGVVLPQRGEFAVLGRSLQEGMQLALDEEAPQGNLIVRGRAVRLDVRIEDDRGDPATGEAAVRRVAEQGAAVLIAGVQPDVTASAARAAEDLGVPMIVPAVTDAALTRGRRMIFRVCFDDRAAGRAMATYAFDVLNARRAALVYDRASASNEAQATGFIERFRRLGGGTVGLYTFAGEPTEAFFRPLLAAIRRPRPDVIFAPNIYRATAALAVQARAAGLRVPLLSGPGADSPDFPPLGGEAVDGVAYPVHFALDDPDPRVAAFRTHFSAVHGRDPDALAALGYDAMRLALDALRRAAGTDPQGIRAALASTREFPGVSGTLSFQGTDADKQVTVVRIRGGTVVFAARIGP